VLDALRNIVETMHVMVPFGEEVAKTHEVLGYLAGIKRLLRSQLRELTVMQGPHTALKDAVSVTDQLLNGALVEELYVPAAMREMVQTALGEAAATSRDVASALKCCCQLREKSARLHSQVSSVSAMPDSAVPSSKASCHSALVLGDPRRWWGKGVWSLPL
jgi:hypothetical protein